MIIIKEKQFDEERALYNLTDAEVRDCIFAGPADGESALKESRRVTVRNCAFSLRYPLWHAEGYTVIDSTMDELTRAPIWYARDGRIEGSRIHGIKCLRECDHTTIVGSEIVSPEFGWRCRDLTIADSVMESEYFLFDCRRVTVDRLNMKGKYSFQYVEDMVIRDSVLDTKDAFWHSKNVRVENSTVKGEYLGWFSEGLTLVNCHIVGTQPLCYCKDLTLIDCTMEGTDLSFEYSEVEATVKGEILSVKNPKSGHITADRIGDVVYEGSILTSACEITQRKLCVFP
jgi:hypothetical protein